MPLHGYLVIISTSCPLQIPDAALELWLGRGIVKPVVDVVNGVDGVDEVDEVDGVDGVDGVARVTRVENGAASGAELATCFEIRRIVFVEEQGVSREEEFDDLDATCVHFLARRDGEAVGTARLHPQSDVGKAQRVAVLARARRGGVGAELMLAIETEAHRLGLSQVVLHAQTSAIPFYESIGYRAEGEEFVEADIPHRFMRKILAPHSPDSGSTA